LILQVRGEGEAAPKATRDEPTSSALGGIHASVHEDRRGGATGRVGSRVVELLEASGHDVVPMSRSTGVDMVTGEGLAEALAGAECVIDCASGTASGPQRRAPEAASEFFTASARNLHEAGQKAGVERMVEVSVIGIDHFTAGQGAAKYAHEKAMLARPIPVRVLRAAQFHEFVPQLIEWGTQGNVAYVRKMRIQSVASRAVAQALVDLATDPAWAASPARSEPPLPEIAGPREENLVGMAELFVARRGISLRIQGVTDPTDPDNKLYEDGSLLPNLHATLAGPTFEAWLDSDDASTTTYGTR
jgi:NAD(P)H-binding